MNNLLIFFAFPIAVIIISAVLQRLLDNPAIVAALIFAIFLIITFTAFDETFLIATLAYTVLAFITALVTDFLLGSNNNDDEDGTCGCGCSNTRSTAQEEVKPFNYTYNRYKNF